ncbi:DUF2267 domain-containing protein [Archangium lansingense]|uniref:DUF2267 domain-containing protein n=1 Tax=Archangium lansingense TaxID=2995310 RepID=A0ABT4AMD1_9BACT|nr:DUF2267 domain-containing protein [Archangium lansinium]MCY1082846.1 DUF2267 domain-containing protein [Archangium lansinium]
MAMMQNLETESWSGEGVGTSMESFLARINREVPEYSPTEVADAVMSALCERLPGGLVQEMREQFPESLRRLFERNWKERSAPAQKFEKDDFYLDIAERLQIEPENVRLVLHVVFGSIHSQITERLAEKLVAEMPPNIAGTFNAARRDADLPR